MPWIESWKSIANQALEWQLQTPRLTHTYTQRARYSTTFTYRDSNIWTSKWSFVIWRAIPWLFWYLCCLFFSLSLFRRFRHGPQHRNCRSSLNEFIRFFDVENFFAIGTDAMLHPFSFIFHTHIHTEKICTNVITLSSEHGYSYFLLSKIDSNRTVSTKYTFITTVDTNLGTSYLDYSINICWYPVYIDTETSLRLLFATQSVLVL